MLTTSRIPVLIYHKDIVDENDATNGFAAQMQALYNANFQSITIEQYYNWRNGGSLPGGVVNPFIAIFDDSYDTTYTTAYNAMNTANFNFVGVTAVITNQVNAGASGSMTWSQIRDLVYNKGWDVASHSMSHEYLGDGEPDKQKVSASQFQNEPSEVASESSGSKSAIEAHVFDDANSNGVKDTGEASLTPKAFVHPHDDATTRTLATLQGDYPLVFAASYPISYAAAGKNVYVNSSTGGQNGQLIRIGIYTDTTIAQFNSMLSYASGTATLTDPAPSFKYPSSYITHGGTVVIDGEIDHSGNWLNDTITLGSDTLTTNGTAKTKTDFDDISADTYVTPVAMAHVDMYGGAGHDSITLTSTFTGTTGRVSIVGGSGDDTLTGTNAAADYIQGSSGNDDLFGQGGNDEIRGGTGNDDIGGGGNNDTIYGDDGADTIIGDGQADVIYGGIGNDFLQGGADNDSIYGDDGNDTLNGNNGNDVLWGYAGVDTYITNGDSNAVDSVGFDNAVDIWTLKDTVDVDIL
ncbi:MAG: polysaccharide deacetylase family protein [Tepidisphaeraceae bacterium]